MKMFDVYSVHDISIVTGRGSWVYDAQGTKYLDMYGGHAVISIGHANPGYVEAVTGQLGRLGFYSNSVVISQQAELAEALGRLSGLSAKGTSTSASPACSLDAPSANLAPKSTSTSAPNLADSQNSDWQLFLCNSGAEANENALKLASFHTGRRKVISVGGAFHGRTSLAVAATDNPKIVAPINETNNVIFTPINDIEALERAFASAPSDAGKVASAPSDAGKVATAPSDADSKIASSSDSGVAAVIVEAIQGVAGIVPCEPDFLRAIRRLCD
ncbi:MAG: aminotransferase class III-fold pyridoxal phosphate-dependent enzyme, partial [Alistipes sp.]|nr:aminotransferase class III-fold pyridoxal phosphate-dependent enzyme [Alistipes sp.]